MVGTRGKGPKSKSRDLAFVHDEPEPLQTLISEAAEGSLSEEAKVEVFYSEAVPLHVDEKQLMDDGHAIGYEINDGDVTVLTSLDEDDKLEDVSDGGNAITNIEVENRLERTNENETEADMTVGGDAVPNVDVKGSNEGTNAEELEENENLCTGKEEKKPDINACVTNADEGLAASKHVLEENSTEYMHNDKEANELIAEVSVNTRVENEGDEFIKENASPTNEVIAAAEKVIQPKKKIIRKKLIRKNIALGNVSVSSPAENGGVESIKEDVSPANEVIAAAEKVIQPKKKIVRKKLIKKNISLGNAPVSSPAENGGDESIKDEESVGNEAIVAAENVLQPKKKIVRELIRKRLSLGNVTAVNEAKLQLSAGNEGSGVPCEAGTSAEVKPQCLEDNDTSGEVRNEGQIENSKNEETVEGKPIVKINKKVNRIRKKNPQGQPGMQTAIVEQKPELEPTNDDPTSKENQPIEHETENEEAVKPKPRISRSQKRKNRKAVDESTQNVDAEDVDRSGSSKKSKLPKKVDGMGMIFMCNSETKKDCYKYTVFGLPAAKKDIVSKIYKGMRLFLFDIDLKMLYGIYKAAGPGSYNVEPRAFKSQYPSQVRFTILEDCLPVAEEKFKKVIKENYFTKNKFDCQLTSEQVKNLCKLFHEANKRSESKLGGRNQRAVATSSSRVDRKRKWEEDSSKRVGLGPSSSRGRERRRKVQEPVRHVHMIRGQETRYAPVVRVQEETSSAVVVRGQEQLRLVPMVTDQRYRHPVVVYDRESYRPPVTSSSLYQPIRGEDPPRTRIYTYERDPGVDSYRRDSTMEYRDPGISAPRDSRHYVEPPTLREPYTTYREPLVYCEPAYVTETRQDPYNYSLAEGREYYRSDDNRPPLPLHRRY
ncbi:uncharacterized protein LOC141633277 [Silene latifolia]|uniref:uncharacterized protein LOC141633277 n=1 Tax=Silene latifolia TaxID=37657 RepID=UPI003D773868